MRCPACNVPIVVAPGSLPKCGNCGTPYTPPAARKRREQAEVPLKVVRFRGPEARKLARRLETKALLEGRRMDDLIVHLLQVGLQHEPTVQRTVLPGPQATPGPRPGGVRASSEVNP